MLARARGVLSSPLAPIHRCFAKMRPIDRDPAKPNRPCSAYIHFVKDMAVEYGGGPHQMRIIGKLYFPKPIYHGLP